MFTVYSFRMFHPYTLPRYVYERLVAKGRKPGFYQLFATQITSAIWHGLYPGELKAPTPARYI